MKFSFFGHGPKGTSATYVDQPFLDSTDSDGQSLAAHLPYDILVLIFSYLPVNYVVRVCSLLNKHWLQAARDYKLPMVTLRREYAETCSKLATVQNSWPRLVQVCFENTVTSITTSCGDWDVQALDLRGSRISDITPIQSCSGLVKLFLSYCHVDVGPLAALYELDTLVLVHSECLTDIQPLAGLPKLRHLDVSHTPVLDIGPVSTMPALEVLYLRRTWVRDLSPCAKCPRLQVLDISQTQACSSAERMAWLQLLADSTSLRVLYAERAHVKDDLFAMFCAAFSKSQIHTLNVSWCALEDLTPISGLRSLKSLSLQSTRIGNVAPLASLVALTSLDVSGLSVSDFSPLNSCTELEILKLYGSYSVELQTISCPKVHTLQLSETDVSNISHLQSMPQVAELDLAQTYVSDISPLIHHAAALINLDLSHTSVSDITVLGHCLQLRKLNISFTSIHDLRPLEGCLRLSELVARNTRVDDIGPLRQCVSMATLDLCNTHVADIAALARLAVLTSLHIGYTVVGDVGCLATCPRLSLIDARHTRIASVVGLTGCPALTDLNVVGARVADLHLLTQSNPRLRISK